MTSYRIGFENMRAEAWEEAAKSFRAAAEIDPSVEMAHYMLGRVHMNRKRFAEAATAYVKARNLYQAQAGRRFASTQEAQRYRRDRILEIDQYIRELQSRVQTLQIQEQLRQLNEQKRQLQEYVQRGDNVSIDATVPSYVSLSLGSAYFRLGALAEAEKAYRETVASDPKSGEAYNNLAVVYLETGRLDDAEKALKTAERVGFKVHPQLKEDIRNRRKAGTL